MRRNDLMKREMSRALKELAKTHELKSISVTQLVNVCGMSRGTFYNHFLDIYDLINWTFETDVIEPLQEYITAHDENWSGITQQCLEKMYADRSFYTQAVQRRGQNSLRDYMRKRNLDSWKMLIAKYMGDNLRFDPDALDFIERYTSQAVGNMIIKWAEDGMPLPPKKMAYMDKVATRGIYGLIDEANGKASNEARKERPCSGR